VDPVPLVSTAPQDPLRSPSFEPKGTPSEARQTGGKKEGRGRKRHKESREKKREGERQLTSQFLRVDNHYHVLFRVAGAKRGGNSLTRGAKRKGGRRN